MMDVRILKKEVNRFFDQVGRLMECASRQSQVWGK